jgi:uncharacterized protein
MLRFTIASNLALTQTQAPQTAPAPTAPVQPGTPNFPWWLIALPIGAGIAWWWLRSRASNPTALHSPLPEPIASLNPASHSPAPFEPGANPSAPVTVPIANQGIQPFNTRTFPQPTIIPPPIPVPSPTATQPASNRRDMPDLSQSQVEAAKYNVGQEYPEVAASEFSSTDIKAIDLATVDQDLPDLPRGYGEPSLILLARDPQWGYAYWDLPNAAKQTQRDQGGVRLALRLYDVTHPGGAAPLAQPHSTQQYEIDELAQNWYLPIPVGDRDYVAELGYLTVDDQWLSLVRSPVVHIPPVYPSDWQDDQMVTIAWDEPLIGRHFGNLQTPDRQLSRPHTASGFHDAMFQLSRSEVDPVAGSMLGWAQEEGRALSSFLLPSSHEWASGQSYVQNHVLGAGDSAWLQTHADANVRQFWFVADAELIVCGATEPSAQVTIDGNPIQLNADGSFRIQLSFQDGQLQFPVVAIAQDGVQTRQVELQFERQTPRRRTNLPGQEP